MPRPNAARIVVVQGDASLRELEITKECELGRGDSCDVVLLDGAASRRHARIESRGPDYYIVDLGSTNGSFVNGKRIHESKLIDGDEIVLGGVRIKFRAAMAGETMVVGGAPPRAKDTNTNATISPAARNLELNKNEETSPKAPLGRNAQFLAARAVAERASLVDLPILLRGETGTGKEVFAHYIHSRSQRSSGPFIALHAAAIPAPLFEAELFGAEKGAYTGSDTAREGYLTSAAGGTLFLDEVGELPLDAQIKLLRVLDTGEFHSIGSSLTKRTQFRLIAATNRDLERSVRDGTFRGDLLFRLNAIEIKLPPLRERRDDLGILVSEFLKSTGKQPSEDLLEEVAARKWPGNLRELKHALERAAMMADGEILHSEHLPMSSDMLDATISLSNQEETRHSAVSLDEAEARAIQRALRKTGGKRGEAAKLLGISEPTLRRKLRRLHLETNEEES